MPTSSPVAKPDVPAELLHSKEALLKLYEQMMLLRRFELAAQVLNRNGKLPGFLHLYIGEEATAVDRHGSGASGARALDFRGPKR